MKRSPLTWLVVPPGVVTKMSTVVPVAPDGAVAVIVVSLTTVKGTDAPLKVTVVAPVKNEPEIVTVVPPLCEPLDGPTDVTTGIG